MGKFEPSKYNVVIIDSNGKILAVGNRLYLGSDNPDDKASGSDINTGTDNDKYVTAEAIANSNIAFLSDIVSVTAEDEIAAFVGGGQPSATVLSKTYNLIDTVASTGDSCKLIPAVSGDVKFITNLSLNDMDLFPALGEKFIMNLTDLGTDAPTVVSAGQTLQCVCYQTGIWRFI